MFTAMADLESFPQQSTLLQTTLYGIAASPEGTAIVRQANGPCDHGPCWQSYLHHCNW